MQEKIIKLSLVLNPKSFETVAKFQYLVKAVTNKNYIREEIKGKLISGTFFCYTF
jgi:hypothetical protein